MRSVNLSSIALALTVVSASADILTGSDVPLVSPAEYAGVYAIHSADNADFTLTLNVHDKVVTGSFANTQNGKYNGVITETQFVGDAKHTGLYVRYKQPGVGAADVGSLYVHTDGTIFGTMGQVKWKGRRSLPTVLSGSNVPLVPPAEYSGVYDIHAANNADFTLTVNVHDNVVTGSFVDAQNGKYNGVITEAKFVGDAKHTGLYLRYKQAAIGAEDVGSLYVHTDGTIFGTMGQVKWKGRRRPQNILTGSDVPLVSPAEYAGVYAIHTADNADFTLTLDVHDNVVTGSFANTNGKYNGVIIETQFVGDAKHTGLYVRYKQPGIGAADVGSLYVHTDGTIFGTMGHVKWSGRRQRITKLKIPRPVITTGRPKLPVPGSRPIIITGRPKVFDGTFAVGTNLPGSDYRNVALNDNFPSTCRDLCQKEAPCKAWTWVKPGVQNAKAMCWLKNAIPTPNADANTTSGVKVSGDLGVH
jgi:hypothetical protein